MSAKNQEPKSVLTFFDFANPSPDFFQELYRVIMEWFHSVNLPPQRICALGPGFPYKLRLFQSMNARLEKEGFKNLRRLWVESIMPDTPKLLWKEKYIQLSASFLLNEGQNYCEIEAKTSVLDLTAEPMRRLAREIALAGPAYGMGYRRPQEERFAGCWYYEYKEIDYPKQKILLPCVYPLNFLRESQLQNPIHGQTLEQWIRADKKRGNLTEFAGNMTLWTVEEWNLAAVYQALWDADAFFTCRKNHPPETIAPLDRTPETIAPLDRTPEEEEAPSPDDVPVPNVMAWCSAASPKPMLEFLGTKASARQLRLFACACCRRVSRFLAPDALKAVEVAERHADGEASDKELAAAQKIKAARREPRSENGQAWARYEAASAAWQTVALPALEAAAEAYRSAAAAVADATAESSTAAWRAAEKAEKECQAELLRDVCGFPTFPITIKPAWQNKTVITQAKKIYQNRAFDKMPKLCEALEKVGCDNDFILRHCRDPGEHTRGCWVIDLLLDMENKTRKARLGRMLAEHPPVPGTPVFEIDEITGKSRQLSEEEVQELKKAKPKKTKRSGYRKE